MSGQGPIWRFIDRIERFLPTPKAPVSSAAQSSDNRRRGAFVPLIVLPTIIVPTLLRSRHELGAVLRQNIVALQQVFLGFAVVCAVAVVIAAVVTWRRETRRRGGAL